MVADNRVDCVVERREVIFRNPTYASKYNIFPAGRSLKGQLQAGPELNVFSVRMNSSACEELCRTNPRCSGATHDTAGFCWLHPYMALKRRYTKTGYTLYDKYYQGRVRSRWIFNITGLLLWSTFTKSCLRSELNAFITDTRVNELTLVVRVGSVVA